MTRALPDNVLVIGAGGGGSTTAAELSLKGVAVTLADLPEFSTNLDAIADAGGVQMQFRTSPSDTTSPTEFVPIATTSHDPVGELATHDAVVVVVPSFGHRRFADLLAPGYRDGQTVLWVGEGGGAMTAAAALRRAQRDVDVVLGETNSLPYGGAFISEPGRVGATRKRGGTLVAALPAEHAEHVHAIASAIWPWVSPAENVWETLLLNFNAIDHVPAMVCNLGVIQGEGTFRIWGTGGSPGVVNVIAALDAEYLELRRALGLQNLRRYEDYLVDQGMAPERGATLRDTIQNSILAHVDFPCGPNALDHRFVAEDVPYSLVLASSLGDEVDVPTPVMDGLIAVAGAAAGVDYRSQGRTVADWDLDGHGVAGLCNAAEKGSW